MSELNGTQITWLGHATVFLKTARGTSILIDPWIRGNPKYPEGRKPPEALDLILCSHGHSDHSGDVIELAKKLKPKVVGMVELVGYFKSQGVENGVGMNLGGAYRHEDVTVTLVQAHHSSSVEVDGKPMYTGEPSGFILEIEDGPTCYHAGDTAVFGDMRIFRELYSPTLAMLPIGDYYTMGPRQAALAVEYLGVKQVLPIHYGTFPALTGTPEALKAELKARKLGRVEVLQLNPGESYS